MCKNLLTKIDILCFLLKTNSCSDRNLSLLCKESYRCCLYYPLQLLQLQLIEIAFSIPLSGREKNHLEYYIIYII